jgi:hypothetical protein
MYIAVSIIIYYLCLELVAYKQQIQSSVIDITLSRRINTVNIIRGSLILKRKEEEIWKKSKIQTFSIFGRL